MLLRCHDYPDRRLAAVPRLPYHGLIACPAGAAPGRTAGSVSRRQSLACSCAAGSSCLIRGVMSQSQQDPHAATMFLMVGLPAAGKTTRAKELAEAHQALRLTPDH